MKLARNLGVMVLLGVLLSGALAAQTYTNAPYSNDGSPYGFWIVRVTVKLGAATLMNNTSGYTASPYNTYYSGITPPNLVPSSSHTLEVVTMTGSYTMGAGAWIDYNNNGSYEDSGERIGTMSPTTQGAVLTANFTPPGVGGVLRMRVRACYSTSPQTSISNESYGEAEDYPVNMGFAISTPSPLPTGAQGTAYNQLITATNGTTPYNWLGSPSYIMSGSLPAGLSASLTGSPNWQLRIQGTPTGTGTSNFTVSVNDSAGTPKNATQAYQITIVPPPAAMPFNDDFSADKGWQRGTTWQRGVAVAYSATSPPRDEPGTDHSASADNYILGDTIGNLFAANIATTYYAISPMVNCASATTVRLRFWRYMGMALDAPNDGATIWVSNNGTTWTKVWGTINGATIHDNNWTSMYYDITSVAAGAATVQVRFGIGPTGATQHTGWCIDDFLIEQPGPDLQVREGSPTGTLITDNQAVGGARDFGQVNTSTNSAPLNLYFTNVGPANITFGAWVKTGAQPNDFYINSSSFVSPLLIGNTGVLTVTFYRTTVGISTATISSTHNATGSGTSPFEINLRGEAITPNPDIEVRLTNASGPVIPHQQSPTGTPRDFGNRDINAGPSAPITIFIRNIGTGTLNITTPDMAGTWWTNYAVNSQGIQSSLTAGQSTTFEITFDPSSIGSKDAYARIAHTDGGQPSPYYIPVIGVGTTSSVSGMSVVEGTLPGTPIAHNAVATGTARDFGSQLIAGGPTPTVTITISSTGGTALNPTLPIIGGTSPAEFILNTTGFQTVLAPGNSTSFTVAFDPNTIGLKTCTVTFTHDDTSQTTPFIVNFRGTGVNTAPDMEVHETNAAGAQLTNPAPAAGILAFGSQDVNAGPTAVATIYVENAGTAPLTVNVPAFNPAATEFQIQSSGFGGTIAVGANQTFTITFDPATVGAKTAVIEFTHNDGSAGSPFILNVSGTGVLNAPIIEVRDNTTIGPIVASGTAPVPGGSRDLGSIDVSAGNTLPWVIVIMNTGNQNLTMSIPTKSGTNPADFTLNTAGFNTTVAAGNSTQFDVVFDPTLAGIKDCQVTFTQNDPGQATPFVVRFMGTATDPNSVLITTAGLPGAISGNAYTAAMSASQGAAPYVWSIYSGNLPSGLTLSATGQITGTPVGFGSTANVTIRVTDAGGATNEKAFTVQVQLDPAQGKADDNGCAVAGNNGSGTGFALMGLAGASLLALRPRRRNS